MERPCSAAIQFYLSPNCDKWMKQLLQLELLVLLALSWIQREETLQNCIGSTFSQMQSTNQLSRSCKFFCVLLRILFYCNHKHQFVCAVAVAEAASRVDRGKNPERMYSFFSLHLLNSEWLHSGRISSFFPFERQKKTICIDWNVHEHF